MKRSTLVSLFLVLGLLPALASAAVVLTGKTSSFVTASVSRPNNLIVTDDKGGWFEQGLEMQQLGGRETPYEVSARLRVISTSGEVMAEARDIASLDLTSRYKNREFQANLTYTLDGIPPGGYVLETTLRDKNSAKTGTFQTEVEFTE